MGLPGFPCLAPFFQKEGGDGSAAKKQISGSESKQTALRRGASSLLKGDASPDADI